MKIKRYFKKLSDKIQNIVNFILMNLIYFIGIGLTSLIARIFNKRFLKYSYKKSSWNKFISSNIERMY